MNVIWTNILWESSEEETRKLEFELLSCNKELEHHQLEERRTQQTVSQISQDSASIESEMETSRQKENTATSSIKTLEVERTELEEKTKEAQELILEQQSRADVCSEDLLTHRVSLTEITEQQKNTEETVDRLRRESSEIELRLEQLEKSRNDAGIRLDKSRKRITEIDGSFAGMLESRTKLGWIRKQRSRMHNQKFPIRDRFLENETHYFRGKSYPLKIITNNNATFAELNDQHIILNLPPDAEIDKRRSALNEFYRAELMQIIPPLINKWEKILNVNVASFHIRSMKTR